MKSPLEGKKVTLHDMTLRDGMHPKRHRITLEQMKSIACGLDAAGDLLVIFLRVRGRRDEERLTVAAGIDPFGDLRRHLHAGELEEDARNLRLQHADHTYRQV